MGACLQLDGQLRQQLETAGLWGELCEAQATWGAAAAQQLALPGLAPLGATEGGGGGGGVDPDRVALLLELGPLLTSASGVLSALAGAGRGGPSEPRQRGQEGP
jgi:hypothetical protein